MTFRRFRLLVAVITAVFLVAAGVKTPLADLEGQSRILLFFVPDEQSPNLEDQLERLEPYRSALEQRRIVPIAVIGNDRVEDLSGRHEFSGEAAKALRDRFGVDTAAAFAGFMIALDGKLLWQDNAPVAMSEMITVFGDR